MRLVRTLWQFVNPRRTAGRIALGRVAILTQLVAATIFIAYTAHQKTIRVPLLTSKAYVVQVVFPDAKGLDTADSPAAAVAGNPSGQVTEVKYRNGRALVTIKLDQDLEGKIFADASAQLRPASALQNLLVNISPGTPRAGPLPDGRPIPPQRTTTYPAIDDVTGIFDADVQAYTSILIHEARRALRHREGRLRDAVVRLAQMTDPATSLSRALAHRRRLLTRLVGDLSAIFQTVGRRGRELADAIDAGDRTLRVTASRQAELAAVTRRLAPVLLEAQRGLAAIRRLAAPMVPALARLEPAGRPFARGLARLERVLPRMRALLGQVDAVARRGREPTALLVDGTRGLKARVEGLGSTADQVVAIARSLDKYKEGAAQLATTLSGAISSQDRGGPYGQVNLLKIEGLRPQDFGLAASATAAQRAQLERQVATLLEQLCSGGSPGACLTRFGLPQLSARPLPSAGRRHG